LGRPHTPAARFIFHDRKNVAIPAIRILVLMGIHGKTPVFRGLRGNLLVSAVKAEYFTYVKKRVLNRRASDLKTGIPDASLRQGAKENGRYGCRASAGRSDPFLSLAPGDF
jgi:hypothetical protein